MIRLATVIGLALVAVMALVLYRLKAEVHGLEDRLAGLDRAAVAEQEAVRVLNAEWSYLNRPERLAALTAAHLDLVPMIGQQLIAAVTDLPHPMPAADAVPLRADDGPAAGAGQ